MGKKDKQGGGGNSRPKSSGGGGGLTTAQRLALEAITDASEKKRKKKEQSELAKVVVKKLGGKKKAKESDSDSSDSNSDSSSSSVEEKRKKAIKKYKRRSKAAEKALEDSKTETKRLRDIELEYTALKAKVEERLSPEKAATGSTRTKSAGVTIGTLEEWEDLRAAASRHRPPAPKRRGLFDDLLSSKASDNEAKVLAIISNVEKYMEECEAKESFGGAPGKVSTEAETRIQKVGAQVAAVHFSDISSHTDTSVPFERLKELKTKFIATSQTKIPKTIMCAMLRSLVSRDVSMTADELGIEDDA